MALIASQISFFFFFNQAVISNFIFKKKLKEIKLHRQNHLLNRGKKISEARKLIVVMLRLSSPTVFRYCDID